MPVTNKVAVRELFVTCSYPMRPDAIAASDTCQEHATSAVKTPKGNFMWRCVDHSGRLDSSHSGEIVEEVTYGRV